MSAEIRWEDPPESQGGRPGAHDALFAALRENPGRWALVCEAKTTRAAASRAGNLRMRRKQGFEITARGQKVYARFIGDETQDPPSAGRETASEVPTGAIAEEKPVVVTGRVGAMPASGPRAPSVPEEERRRIGSRVRAARKARRMTQEAVGRELQTSGALVSLLEGGQKVSAPVIARAAAWVEAPHPNDNLPAKEHGKDLPPHAARQVARKMSPVMRSKKSAPPATDWRPSVPSTPMALPKGMELHLCPALRARITETACAANKARAKGDVVLEAACPSCPGVAALSKRRASA